MTTRTNAGVMPLLATTVAVAEPIMTIPQAWEIWSNRSAVNISLISWSFSLFGALVWLVYGVQIKNKPVIISSMCWIVVEVVVIAGIYTFRSS